MRPGGTNPLDSRGLRRCSQAPYPYDAYPLRAELLYLHPPLQPGQSAFAQLRVQNVRGGESESFALTPGSTKQLSDGSLLAAEGLGPRPAILLRHRRAPGNPLALVSSILLGLGLLLMWRRFTPRAGAV